MGRITEKVNKFLLRLANRLGIKKDNLLESAKENLKQMGPVINNAVPRDTGIKEEILSDRDKFAKELQEHATRFDPSFMSKEEAIMKILEQQGLNPEFAKNPEAVEQISKICDQNLRRAGIENITLDNLNDTKSAITSSLTILDNGDLRYDRKQEAFKNKPIEATDPTVSSNTIKLEEQKIFNIGKDNMFQVTDLRNEQVRLKDKSNKLYMTRIVDTYNKNGLQMKRKYMHEVDDLSSNKSIDSKTYTLERNQDLVTAKLTVQKYGDFLGTDGDYQSNADRGSTIKNVYLETQQNGKNGLYCTTPINLKYDDIVKANLENRPVEKEVPYYSVVDEPEKYEEQKKYHDKLIKDSARESATFRKTAEENGLLEKEATLEQE